MRGAPFFILLGVFLANDYLLPFLLSIGGNDYALYVLRDFNRPNLGYVTKGFWVMNFIISCYFCFGKHSGWKDLYLALLSLVAVVCFWIGLQINYVDRVGYYFLPCIMMLYDRGEYFIVNKTKKFFYSDGLILFFISYFYYWTYTNEAITYDCIVS